MTTTQHDQPCICDACTERDGLARLACETPLEDDDTFVDVDTLCQCGHLLDDHGLEACGVDACDCDGPYVCPDCHAVGAQRCAAWCPDLEARSELEEQDAAELFDVEDDS